MHYFLHLPEALPCPHRTLKPKVKKVTKINAKTQDVKFFEN